MAKKTQFTRRTFLKHSAIGIAGLGLVKFSCTPIQKYDSEVIILGAGLSGLSTALQLERMGIDYHIFEAQDRFGGRINTRYDLPNRPDVGGRGIGNKYERTLAYVKEFGLDLVDVTHTFRRPSIYHIGGELINNDSWSKSKQNNLSQKERSILPSRLESYFLNGKMKYKELTDWFSQDFSSEDRTLAELLQESGASDEALKLINLNCNYNDIFSTSAVNALHGVAFRKFNGSSKVYNLAAGSSSLPEAMAKKLSNRISLNTEIVKISAGQNSISIKTKDGKSFKGKALVCTLPFSVLRDLEINAPLSTTHQDAIQTLGYTKITQIHMLPKTPFWEKDGLPVSMWTDGPLERIMNFSIGKDCEHIVAWINGNQVDKIDKLQDQEIKNLCLKEMAKMRPASKDNIEVIHVHSWANQPFAKGAYAEFQAGQVKRFFPAMNNPIGPIFFAGEHTARSNRGIEAALESGERVSKEIEEYLKLNKIARS